MTDASNDPTGRPRPHSAESSRPRPQYGEYATPEEQRARISQPDTTWAIETGQAPAAVSAAAPAAEPQSWPIDDSPPPRSRNGDRIVTLALLVIGALNVAVTAISYFNLAELADQAMKLLGIDGEFTNFAAAQLWGPIAAGVLLLGYLLTVFLAWRNVWAGRLSWWIPVVGAIVTYIGVYVCLAVPLLGDPAFIQYATSPG
jgi:energy-converting hydrogenase Eha subunit C